MIEGGSASAQRRRLRAELRSARHACGLTQEQAADEMDWSLSKIIRIESGSRGISTNDLIGLLRLYQITEPGQTNLLLGLAAVAWERSWWNAYRDIAPTSLLQLIDYESAASVIRQFELTFIPGILQTEEYARAVIQDYYDERSGSERLGGLVELRVRREGLLNSENPPSFQFILDEAAVRRIVGRPSVMRRQLERLIEWADKPHITLRLIPFTVGLHPGVKGAFEIIESADHHADDVVFLESPRGDIVSADPEIAMTYREAFEQLVASSLVSQDSLARLGEIANEIL
jgi:transcriptional regulator with XRE-family HTH domain